MHPTSSRQTRDASLLLLQRQQHLPRRPPNTIPHSSPAVIFLDLLSCTGFAVGPARRLSLAAGTGDGSDPVPFVDRSFSFLHAPFALSRSSALDAGLSLMIHSLPCVVAQIARRFLYRRKSFGQKQSCPSRHSPGEQSSQTERRETSPGSKLRQRSDCGWHTFSSVNVISQHARRWHCAGIGTGDSVDGRHFRRLASARPTESGYTRVCEAMQLRRSLPEPRNLVGHAQCVPTRHCPTGQFWHENFGMIEKAPVKHDAPAAAHSVKMASLNVQQSASLHLAGAADCRTLNCRLLGTALPSPTSARTSRKASRMKCRSMRAIVTKNKNFE